MIEQHIQKKITDLIARSASFETDDPMARTKEYVANSRTWMVEALSVARLLIQDADHPYRRAVSDAAAKDRPWDNTGLVAKLLKALVDDVNAGLVGRIENKIAAETFDNFLDHAEHYRSEGRPKESGVIAGVVFEDTVRRVYRLHIGDDTGKKLDALISELSSNGHFSGLRAKEARVGAHVRTKATHAQWDEFTLDSVESTIRLTKNLIREHLDI